MEEIEATYLAFSWSVSRGRETYGYNIMTITDQNTGKRFRCNGGGYDMTGTSFGNWLMATYQGRLLSIKDQAAATYSSEDGYVSDHEYGNGKRYGMCYNADDNRVSLDGACGLTEMVKIAGAIGLKLERTYKATGRNRGETTGYIVSAA